MDENVSIVTNGGPVLDKAMYESKADYFKFDEILTREQTSIRHKFRRFCEKNILPVTTECWNAAKFPPIPLIKQFSTLPMGGGYVKGYGCAGADPLTYYVANMEIYRTDSALGTLFAIHNSMSCPAVWFNGTEEQKRKYLPAFASYDKLCGWALTEVKRGSDAANLTCKARQETRNGVKGWVINGTKRWIGIGTNADYLILYTGDEHKKGVVHAFILPIDTPGFYKEPIKNKIAFRTMINGHLLFKDCFLPESQRMPGCTNFRNGPGKVLYGSRVTVGWGAVGMAMGAFDCCLNYCTERTQFGAPIASYQLIQARLAEMLGLIQGSLYMMWRLTNLYSKGTMTPGQSAVAKAYTTKSARTVMRLARETMGGNGILADHRVGRHFADIEALYTYEGTYDINVLLAGREITGINAFLAPKPSKSSKSKSKSKSRNSTKRANIRHKFFRL